MTRRKGSTASTGLGVFVHVPVTAPNEPEHRPPTASMLPSWVVGAPIALCDVGGCGNSTTNEEVAIRVTEEGDIAAQYLEVTLCDEHPELAHLVRNADSSVLS